MDQTIVGTAPPATDQAAPTTFDAGSEHRNATTAAISSSVPIRPIGSRPAVAASTSSRVRPDARAFWSASPPGDSHSSPATGPGETELTSTPRPANRSAYARDSD